MGSYCTIDLVKKLGQQDYDKWGSTFTTNALYEAFISNELIPNAEEKIDDFCSRDFNLHSAQTEYLDGNGQFEITPKHIPIISVTGLYSNDDYMGKGTWTLEDEDDYVVYDGKIFFEVGFTTGYKNFKLIYSYGYSEVPRTVRDVCAQIVVNMLRYMIAMRTTAPFMAQPTPSGTVQLNVPDMESFPRVLRTQLFKYIQPRLENQ